LTRVPVPLNSQITQCYKQLVDTVVLSIVYFLATTPIITYLLNYLHVPVPLNS